MDLDKVFKSSSSDVWKYVFKAKNAIAETACIDTATLKPGPLFAARFNRDALLDALFAAPERGSSAICSVTRLWTRCMALSKIKAYKIERFKNSKSCS